MRGVGGFESNVSGAFGELWGNRGGADGATEESGCMRGVCARGVGGCGAVVVDVIGEPRGGRDGAAGTVGARAVEEGTIACEREVSVQEWRVVRHGV